VSQTEKVNLVIKFYKPTNIGGFVFTKNPQPSCDIAGLTAADQLFAPLVEAPWLLLGAG